jgi:hypothetical protein
MSSCHNPKLAFHVQSDTVVHMRWRIVLSLVAAGAIAGLAVWYSSYLRGREDEIEYHKASYLAEFNGRPMMNGLRGVLCKIAGRKVSDEESAKKLHIHADALLRLGYWQEKTFSISNLPPITVWGTSKENAARTHLTNEIWEAAVTGSNWTVIRVRARAVDMPVWERLIRDADAPRLSNR